MTDITGDPAPTPAPSPAPTPTPTPSPLDPSPDAPWYGALSEEAADAARPSDKAWMEGKKFADPAAMVKAYRGLEAKLGGKNTIELPGEGATDEQRAAFAKAIGVPDSVDGYEFAVPEGWEQDLAFLGPMREAALKGGMPVGAWKELAGAYAAQAMDAHNALVNGQNAERDALLKEWGAQKDQNLALVKRGAEAFGLSADDVQLMQNGLGQNGSRKMLEHLLKLGQLSGEDGFIPGAAKSFGISSAEARAELGRLERDRDFGQKLLRKDPDAVARHQRLIAIVSADEDRQRAAG